MRVGAWYDEGAWAEDRATLESDPSADPGDYTAGQRAEAICPLFFPAQPAVSKSDKLTPVYQSGKLQAGTSCSPRVAARPDFPNNPARRFSLRRKLSPLMLRVVE